MKIATLWIKYVMDKLGLPEDHLKGVNSMASARALSWRAASASLLKKKKEDEEKKGSAKRQRK